jgi:hypothetical protein
MLPGQSQWCWLQSTPNKGYPVKLIPTRKTVFTVRIIYKSGYTQDINLLDFTWSDGQINWESINGQTRPIKIGVDEIAAVYQLSERKCFFWR